MSHGKIANALAKHLESLPNAPEIAWENAPFTPQTGQPWLLENYLPAETVGTGMANSDSLDYTGIYQVDVRVPADDYKAVANQLADDVISHFKRGTVISYDGQDVKVETVTRAQGRNDEGWWFVPVTINWRAFSGNV